MHVIKPSPEKVKDISRQGLFFCCYNRWLPPPPPPASLSVPDAGLADAAGTRTPPSVGRLRYMHPLTGGFLLTHRDFASAQGFAYVNAFFGLLTTRFGKRNLDR